MTKKWRAIINDVPEHRKLGYAFHKEREAIRARLKSMGIEDGLKLNQMVDDAYWEAHKDDPAYKDKSEARKERYERLAALRPKPFTSEELEAILRRFEGSNNELGIGIAEKASRMMIVDD